MAVDAALIRILGGDLIYTLPAQGSDAEDFNIPLKLSNANRLVFEFPDTPYNAVVTLSQAFSQWVFTPGGGEQIVIALRGGSGGSLTLRIPQSITQYVSGGGFTGSGEIRIIGISAVFTPDQAPQHIWSFLPSDTSSLTGGGFPIASQGSTGYQLNGASGLPTPTVADGAMVFGGNSAIITPSNPASASAANVYTVVGIKSNDGGGANGVWVARTDSATNNVARGDDVENRTFNLTAWYWNGQTDGSGGVLAQTNNGYLGVFEAAIPTSTWTFFIIKGAGNSAYQYRLMGNGIDTTRDRDGTIFWFGQFQGNGSAADNTLIQQIQGYLAWLVPALTDNAVAASAFLAANHPYINGPPGGGPAGTITADVVVASFDRIVSGAPSGCAITLFRRSGSLLADRSQFTLATGNDSGDGDLVISQTIPVDTPSSGHIRVARDDGTEDRLAYSSWDASTFTLDSVTLPVSYSSGNGAYVGYLDILGSSTGTESNSLQYVSDRDCVLDVRLGSGSGRIRPIRQNVTLGASDFEFQVSAFADAVNTST